MRPAGGAGLSLSLSFRVCEGFYAGPGGSDRRGLFEQLRRHDSARTMGTVAQLVVQWLGLGLACATHGKKLLDGCAIILERVLKEFEEREACDSARKQRGQ